MLTLKKIKEDISAVNRLRIKTPSFRMMSSPRIPTEDEIQATTDYVQTNTVPSREGRKCVDGPYPPDTARGMLARAGGDCAGSRRCR